MRRKSTSKGGRKGRGWVRGWVHVRGGRGWLRGGRGWGRGGGRVWVRGGRVQEEEEDE